MSNVLSLDRILPGYTQEFNREELSLFLTDNQIGPLTGLAKRFADLDLYEEAYEFEDPNMQAKIILGVLASYYLRDTSITPPKTPLGKMLCRMRHRAGNPTHESQMLQHIVYDERNPLSGEDIYALEREIKQPGRHRFEVLHYDFKDLRAREQDLVRQSFQHKYGAFAKPLPDLSEKLQDERKYSNANDHYQILKQLLGISLAQGDMDEVAQYKQELEEFPDRVNHEKVGHTTAVINYLNNGGEERLRKRAAEPRYRWNDLVGTENHPGKIRHHVQGIVSEGMYSGLVNAGFLLLSIGAGVAAYHYRPEISELAKEAKAYLEAHGFHAMAQYVNSMKM